MIKMAIVGAGLWANEHARIFAEMDNVECVAICDVNKEKADHFAAINHIPQVYYDHREMLQKSGCDAISIVTPDFLHTQIAGGCG